MVLNPSRNMCARFEYIDDDSQSFIHAYEHIYPEATGHIGAHCP